MAALTAASVEHGVSTTGLRTVVASGALSNDYVVGVSELINFSTYIGVIDCVQITTSQVAVVANVKLDTANCDYDNSIVSLAAIDTANAAVFAANTDLSTVTFDIVVYGKMRKG